MINGRLPRYNNQADVEKLGSFHMRFDFYPNKPGVWTSYIDGTLSGGQDGTQQWYDYYDNDTIDFLEWQSGQVN